MSRTSQARVKRAQGQLSDLGKGISDRVQGTLGAGVAGITGNQVEQTKYNDQRDEGKSRQRGVEMDLQKKAEAEQK